MNRLAQLDHRYVWHPFTQMQDWLRTEPIVLVEGKGAVLRDVKGREISTPTPLFGPTCMVTGIPASTRPSDVS